MSHYIRCPRCREETLDVDTLRCDCGHDEPLPARDDEEGENTSQTDEQLSRRGDMVARMCNGDKADARSMLARRMAIVAAAVAALSGCATCERHPVACGTALVFVAGSIAASTARHGTQAPEPDGQMSIPLTPNCNVYPSMCK